MPSLSTFSISTEPGFFVLSTYTSWISLTFFLFISNSYFASLSNSNPAGAAVSTKKYDPHSRSSTRNVPSSPVVFSNILVSVLSLFILYRSNVAPLSRSLSLPFIVLMSLTLPVLGVFITTADSPYPAGAPSFVEIVTVLPTSAGVISNGYILSAGIS